jgi:hypothetical protein
MSASNDFKMWATLMKTKLKKQSIIASTFVTPHGDKKAEWIPLDTITKTVPLKEILKNIAHAHSQAWDETIDPTSFDESLFLK